jgi:hypothetical protein
MRGRGRDARQQILHQRRRRVGACARSRREQRGGGGESQHAADGATVRARGRSRHRPQTLATVGGKGRAAAVIARGTTRVPAGKSRRITVKLTAAGKRLRARTIKVRLRIVATSPDGTKATITRRSKLTRRR